MKFLLSCLIAFGLAACPTTSAVAAEPPFSGTIFVEDSIFLPDDPTAFEQLTSLGVGERMMFDRRTDSWTRVNARLFRATFDDGNPIEVHANPEFDAAEAQRESERYLRVIGQLPRCLRKDIESVWIHKGNKPFGGGTNNVLIHTEMGQDYLRRGILAETLCHEAAHTSLDQEHATSDRWTSAQKRDGGFISEYAEANPRREDIAESFLLFLAVRHRGDRISDSLRQTVEETIPHRIRYFDSLDLPMEPFVE